MLLHSQTTWSGGNVSLPDHLASGGNAHYQTTWFRWKRFTPRPLGLRWKRFTPRPLGLRWKCFTPRPLGFRWKHSLPDHLVSGRNAHSQTTWPQVETLHSQTTWSQNQEWNGLKYQVQVETLHLQTTLTKTGGLVAWE